MITSIIIHPLIGKYSPNQLSHSAAPASVVRVGHGGSSFFTKAIPILFVNSELSRDPSSAGLAFESTYSHQMRSSNLTAIRMMACTIHARSGMADAPLHMHDRTARLSTNHTMDDPRRLGPSCHNVRSNALFSCQLCIVSVLCLPCH